MIKIGTLGVLLVWCCALSSAVPEMGSTAQTPPADRLSGAWEVLSERERTKTEKGTRIQTRTFPDDSFDGYSWIFTPTKATLHWRDKDGREGCTLFDYRVDASRDTLWLDLVMGKDSIALGRAKIEKDRMTWMRGAWVSEREWDKANGFLSDRPRHFDLKKGDGSLLLVMTRRR